jgi:hypothetical protein
MPKAWISGTVAKQRNSDWAGEPAYACKDRDHAYVGPSLRWEGLQTSPAASVQVSIEHAAKRPARVSATQPAAANNHRSDTETVDYLAQAFSGIELLVAIDVIESAISEGRKRVGLQVLKAGAGQADGGAQLEKAVRRLNRWRCIKEAIQCAFW